MVARQRNQIKVVTANEVEKQRRFTRVPEHTFNLKAKPYAIVPFCCVPTLPGETLTHGLLQSRVVTDPINHPLIGWWKEYYLFHVPWRGMPDFASTLSQMALNDTTSLTALKAAANDAAMYTFKGGVKYVEECLEVVVEEFFRDEGEGYTATTIDGYPQAIVDQNRWLQSLKLVGDGADDNELPGVDQLEELDILPGFTNHYTQWELMRDLNMTDVTFEDYLEAEGVNVRRADVHTGIPQLDFKPELIRYAREWTYPTNHIDPTNGTPSSACSWSIVEKITKRRRWSEPGFIFGVTVCRPKIYFGNQKGAYVGAMDSIYNFLPKMLQGESYTGLKEVPASATDGIVQGHATAAWFDLADALVFGDQFVNYAATVASGHAVALPTATMQKRYVASADVTAMFKTAGTEYVKEDGVFRPAILGHVRQTT